MSNERPPFRRATSPIRLALLVSLAMPVVAPPARAQVSKIEWKQDLDFGDTWTGSTNTVTPDASDASHWFIEANPGTNLTLSFTLPANLNSGPNTLPISFATNAAAWDHDSSTTGFTQFNPTQSATMTVSGTSQLYVWLGGSISPPYTQQAGDYAGTIVLIVTVN